MPDDGDDIHFDLRDPEAQVFCAVCGAPFVTLPERCPDCGESRFLWRWQAVEAEERRRRRSGPSPDEDLVPVGSVSGRVEVAYVESLLRDEGIPFVKGPPPEPDFPLTIGPQAVESYLVPRRYAERAAQLLEQALSRPEPPADDEEDSGAP